jgi:DNA-directed RNA polymerase specialized sigma subunit
MMNAYPSPFGVGPESDRLTNELPLPSSHEYLLTEPLQPEDSYQTNPFTSPTPHQQRVLNCLGCAASNGIAGRSAEIAACTGLPSEKIATYLRPFVDAGLVARQEPSAERAIQGRQHYEYTLPSDLIRYAMQRKKACSVEQITMRTALERIPDARKAALACVLCLSVRRHHGQRDYLELPQLAACSKVPPPQLAKLAQTLVEAQVMEPLEPATRPMRYRVTDLGLSMVRGALDPSVRPCMKPPPVANKRNHEAIRRCAECIWSRQVLKQEDVGATATMISQCSGLSTARLAHPLRVFEQMGGALSTTDPEHPLLQGSNMRKALLPPVGFVPLLYKPPGCTVQLYDQALEEQLLADYRQQALSGLHVGRGRRLKPSTSITTWLKDNTAGRRLNVYEEHALFSVIQNSTRPQEVAAATETVIRHMVELVFWSVNQTYQHKFPARFISRDDAVEAAYAGLQFAIRRHNPKLGVRFAHYGHITMRRFVAAAAAEKAGVPHHVFVRIPRLYLRQQQLAQELGREPSLAEIAATMPYSLNVVKQTFDARDFILSALSMDDSRELRHEKYTVPQAPAAERQADIMQTIGPSLGNLVSYLDSTHQEILFKAVLDKSLPIAKLAEQHDVTLARAKIMRKHVRSLMQHPYFGILIDLDESYEWQVDAQCAKEGDTRVLETRRIKADEVLPCTHCPVAESCARQAQRNPRATGIWGGKNYSQQRQSKKPRR